MARPRIVYHWRDNNGGKAETVVYPPEPLTYEAVAGFALATASAFVAVSDARLERYELTFPLDFAGAQGPGPQSNVRSYGLLFYRNADNVSSFNLPSAPELLTETDGPYAGIRITRERLDVLGLLSTVDNLLQGTLDPVGRPYGNSFSVGSRQDL